MEASGRVFGEPSELRSAAKKLRAMVREYEGFAAQFPGAIPAMPSSIHGRVTGDLQAAKDVCTQIARNLDNLAGDLGHTAYLFDKAAASSVFAKRLHGLDTAGELPDFIAVSRIATQRQTFDYGDIPEDEAGFLAWVAGNLLPGMTLGVTGLQFEAPPTWRAYYEKKGQMTRVRPSRLQWSRHMQTWMAFEAKVPMHVRIRDVRRVGLAIRAGRPFTYGGYDFKPWAGGNRLVRYDPRGRLSRLPGAGRFGGPLMIGVGGVLDYRQGAASQREIDYYDPTLTNDEWNQRANIVGGARAAGGVAGGLAGAAGGAQAGAMIGAFGGPVGAAAGGVIGGLVGGIAGGIAGAEGGQAVSQEVLND